MNTTRGIRRLIDDATTAGLIVKESETGCTIRRGKTNRSTGIIIWPDGTATRSDLDVTIATCIRSQKQMRRILGLKTEKGGISLGQSSIDY